MDWGFAQVDQQWYNTPALLADAERMYAEVKTLQPKYWRIGAQWSLIAKQKDPGTAVAGTPPTSTGRDWSTLDTALNEGLLLGSDIILILGVQRPTWGGLSFGPFSFGGTPGTTADFGVWCAETATRYKPGGAGIRTDGKYAPNSGKGVRIFEIWNEQNDQGHDGGQISAKDYTDRLIAGYDAIKAVSGLSGTNSRVMFGGTYHVQRIGNWGPGYGVVSLPEVEFLTQCYTYGAKDHFDAMNVHVYPHLDLSDYNGSDVGPVPTMNVDNMRQIVDIRALMVANGDGAKPISVTEAGFPIALVTEAQQKSYTQTLYNLLAALPYVDMCLFYCARDGGTDMTSINGTLGAMRYDFSHRPLWDFLQTLSPPPGVSPAFGGSGTLAAKAVRAVAAAFSGAGVFEATTPPRVTASFSGAGEVSALADRNSNDRAANFDGAGMLSATANPVLSVTAPFTGLGAFTATTAPRLSVAAPFTGSGALSVMGAQRSAPLTGEGSLSAVAFSAVTPLGAGAGARITTGSTVSWSHTIATSGTDVCVLAAFGVSFNNQAASSFTMSATYGGTSMTLVDLYKRSISGSNGGGVAVFALFNPPTGAQTVSGTAGGTADRASLQGNSVAFKSVDSLSMATHVGSPSVKTITVSSAFGSQVFAVTAGNAQDTAVSGTEWYRAGGVVGGFGDWVAIQSTPGTPSTTLSTTSTSDNWAGSALSLTPFIPGPAPAFAGSGTLSATAVLGVPQRAAALTGSGALTASGVGSYTRLPALAGVGALSATGFEVYARPAGFTGAGALSGSVAGNPAATLTGSGTLAATGFQAYARAATLAGSGALSATASSTPQRNAALTGSGALSALAQVPPKYDATGVGGNALLGFNPSINTTWSHTATGSNRAVIVAIAGVNNSLAATGQTRAVTYGGVSMTSLGLVPDSSGGAFFVELFGLINPATGAQTVSATVSGGGNTGRALIGNSTSYTGVSAFGTAYTNFGPGTAMSVAATSAASEMVVQAFETQGAITAYNQTSRYSGQVVGHTTQILLGDAPGATSVNFTATTALAPFSAIAARLLPV